MKKSIISKRKSVKEYSPICVFLKPCIEKQEMNLFEKFTGTPFEIFTRSIEIITGLERIFHGKDFSMKIDNIDSTQTIYLDSSFLFDNEFNEIGNINNLWNINQ